MTVTITGIEDVNLVLTSIAPNQAKNLLRATVYDMAKTAAETAVRYTPDNPATGAGDLKSSIKPQRGKGSRTLVEASVQVRNIRRNYFWWFLELGDGPDKVEHAMFGKALEQMRPDIDRIYMAAFGKKLEAALVRARKRLGP